MPGQLNQLIEKNRQWSKKIAERDPEFFPTLSRQQSPEYLWIGCADSRVPANEIVGLLPGELFVHRNVANVVVHTDLNCLSVMQYAVDVLKVKHIIVCGHYGCGGVLAALQNQRFGLIDNWLRHIQDVRDKHAGFLASLPDDAARRGRICELNVVEQVINVIHTTIVRDAWTKGQELTVHGWVYGLKDGLVHPVGLEIAQPEDLERQYEGALEGLRTREAT